MAKTKLPEPDTEHAESDVVIYDGKCVFCRGQVERLHRWDGKERLVFVSLHAPFVAENYPDLSHDDLMKQMYVVSKSGKRYGGAAAFRYVATRLPRLWVLVPILYIPFTLPIWQWMYDIVARQRYKLAGKTGDACEEGTCDIHFKK